MEFLDRLITAITETHPLHPMLVHFPIALSGGALLFILLAVWKRNNAFEQAAFFNLALASLSSIFAGLSGMYDNQINYLGDAPNAPVKIALGAIFFLVTAATSIARAKNPNLLNTSKTVYIAAYVVSFAIVLVLAFLGGVILYGF